MWAVLAATFVAVHAVLCLVLHVTVEMEPLATIGSGSGKLRNPAS